MGIVLWGLFNPHLFVKRKECNLRKEKLLGDSLCGAQTPQRVNGSVQLCFIVLVTAIIKNKYWIILSRLELEYHSYQKCILPVKLKNLFGL